MRFYWNLGEMNLHTYQLGKKARRRDINCSLLPQHFSVGNLWGAFEACLGF